MQQIRLNVQESCCHICIHPFHWFDYVVVDSMMVHGDLRGEKYFRRLASWALEKWRTSRTQHAAVRQTNLKIRDHKVGFILALSCYQFMLLVSR